MYLVIDPGAKFDNTRIAVWEDYPDQYCVNKLDIGTQDLSFETEKLELGEYYKTSSMKGRKVVLTMYVFANADTAQMAERKARLQNWFKPFTLVGISEAAEMTGVGLTPGSWERAWSIVGYPNQSIKWSVEYQDKNSSICKAQITLFCVDPWIKRDLYYTTYGTPSGYVGTYYTFYGNKDKADASPIVRTYNTGSSTTYGRRYYIYNCSDQLNWQPILAWKISTTTTINYARLYYEGSYSMEAKMLDPVSSSTWHPASAVSGDIIIADPNTYTFALYSSTGTKKFDFIPWLTATKHKFPTFDAMSTWKNFGLWLGNASASSLTANVTYATPTEARNAYSFFAMCPPVASV